MNFIADYGYIGDCHSCALVGRDGSIDWACFPRFDSPSVFCRALDYKQGGYYQIQPVDECKTDRQYIEDTNVLVTRFSTKQATIELSDCMPVRSFDRDRPAFVESYGSILRRVRVSGGNARVRVSIVPRFEYGSFTPRFRNTSARTLEIVGGADALWVTCSHKLEPTLETLSQVFELKDGEELWIDVAYTSSFVERSAAEHPELDDLKHRFDETVSFWKEWLAGSWYTGPWDVPVRRSALTLKALTYAPTGAVVAAPTTSLPEGIGGVRNWDYRYTWIRDTTLTLISMLLLGFRAEAECFRQWLRRTSSGRARDLQIMYGIDGRRSLPEIELTHLSGHRDSPPVRIGNGAVKQIQLDAYGSILQATYLFAQVGGTISPTNWDFLTGLAELVCENWEKPDQGIWEIRDEPRHFIHSKLLCWVALDRATRIAKERDLPGPLERWQDECERVRHFLIDRCASDGWFPQYEGSDAADASSLLVPAMGFLPPRDPRVLKTIEKVREQLEDRGLVYRYLNADGLDGHEGGFFLCSFWLLDALIHSGQLEESEKLLERLLSLSNDVGLFAEEAVPDTGEPLGNFPQAFTHMALVSSCAHLQAAREGKLPKGKEPYDFAEFALKLLKR